MVVTRANGTMIKVPISLIPAYIILVANLLGGAFFAGSLSNRVKDLTQQTLNMNHKIEEIVNTLLYKRWTKDEQEKFEVKLNNKLSKMDSRNDNIDLRIEKMGRELRNIYAKISRPNSIRNQNEMD